MPHFSPPLSCFSPGEEVDRGGVFCFKTSSGGSAYYASFLGLSRSTRGSKVTHRGKT